MAYSIFTLFFGVSSVVIGFMARLFEFKLLIISLNSEL